MHGYVSKHGMQHALGDCYCDDWAIEDEPIAVQVETRAIFFLQCAI